MCICPLLNHRNENIILKTTRQLVNRESLPRQQAAQFYAANENGLWIFI